MSSVPVFPTFSNRNDENSSSPEQHRLNDIVYFQTSQQISKSWTKLNLQIPYYISVTNERAGSFIDNSYTSILYDGTLRVKAWIVNADSSSYTAETLSFGLMDDKNKILVQTNECSSCYCNHYSFIQNHSFDVSVPMLAGKKIFLVTKISPRTSISSDRVVMNVFWQVSRIY